MRVRAISRCALSNLSRELLNCNGKGETMILTRVHFAIAGLALAGAALLLLGQHHLQTAMRQENALLRQKLAQLGSDNERLSNCLARIKITALPRLPAPPIHNTFGSESPGDLAATNLIAHIVHGGEAPRLTAAQLASYLDANHRSAASLLSAYRTSRDPALLQEALEKYPCDSNVAFEAVLNKDAPPAERRAWLEAFKKAAPDNPLPNYLSALDYFKSGQTDEAVEELIAASSRQRFADYTAERIQTDEEAYRAAGYSEADASMAATWGVPLPQLAEMRNLAQNMAALAASYRQAGDATSAQAALQMTIALGQQLDDPSGTWVPLLHRLVGIAVERTAFEVMDPSSSFGDGSVQAQLDQLAQRRTSIKDFVQQSVPFQRQMTPDDWLTYNQRTLRFGEENAIGWLLTKYGKQ